MTKINFDPFPVLSTKRLMLRRLNSNDETEVFKIRSDKSIAKYLDRPLYKSIDEARQFINKINNGIKENEWIYWAITPKDNDQLIGTICLWQISVEDSKAEIGFELLPEYQGKGYMREAVVKVLDYGFRTMNLSSIEGEVDPKNTKSIKLMESFDFVLNRSLEDTAVYSLLNEYEGI